MGELSHSIILYNLHVVPDTGAKHTSTKLCGVLRGLTESVCWTSADCRCAFQSRPVQATDGGKEQFWCHSVGLLTKGASLEVLLDFTVVM